MKKAGDPQAILPRSDGQPSIDEASSSPWERR